MKKRVISAIVMLALLIPVTVMGGQVFEIGVYLISILALKEFLDVKETKKKLPTFIKGLSYIFMILMIILSTNNGDIVNLNMDYRFISSLFIIMLLPTVLYHDREKYSVNDAFFLIGGIFFLALSMILLISVRMESINLLIYLLIITMLTDTFALFFGMLIGKTKLLEEISPKKTWEGSIGGTLIGSFVSTVFYITVINPNINLLLIIAITVFLSVIGQFGDLVFSAIKRYFGKKDFSNLIPGHGGILDRMDSIIFVLLGVMLFISVL